MPDHNKHTDHITLQEAEKYVPFDANYLGLLIRSERLFGVKKKGRWYTTREAIDTYMKTSARVGAVKKKKTNSILGMAGFGAVLFVALVLSIMTASTFFSGTKTVGQISELSAYVGAGTAVSEENEVSSAIISQR